MEDRRRRGLEIDWDRGLIPLSLLIMIVLYFGFNAPVWLLSVLCLWIPIYYLAIPLLVQNRWKAFDKEFTHRFQKGDYKGLLQFYRGQWLLRRLGPQAEMLGKLGLIYSAMEKYREAEHAFERAIERSRGLAADQLYFNLANIKYDLGKYDDAMQIYRSLRVNSPYKHSVRTQLALIDLHKGARVEQARDLLERERERANDALRLRIDEALALHP